MVFNTPEDAQRVKKTQANFICKILFRKVFCCCVPRQWKWEFERAPEPSDIYWENLGVTTTKRVCNTIKAFAITSCVGVICIYFIMLLKIWQYTELDKKSAEGGSYKEMGGVIFLSFLCSSSVSMINNILVGLIRRFSLTESHETVTKMNVSVAFKLTIARFLNNSIILVMANDEPKKWFKGGSLCYDAYILMLMMAFQAPLFYALDISGKIKQWKAKKEEAKGNNC